MTHLTRQNSHHRRRPHERRARVVPDLFDHVNLRHHAAAPRLEAWQHRVCARAPVPRQVGGGGGTPVGAGGLWRLPPRHKACGLVQPHGAAAI
eukprot:scaffold46793_cov63-Phaeocystis_antarctica.AAC.1